VLQHQKRLAERGYATAQYDLGRRYLRGDGVEKDATVGRQWLQKAAQNGSAEAAQLLQQLADPAP